MPAKKARDRSAARGPKAAAPPPRGRGRPARLSREKILAAARKIDPRHLTIHALAKAVGAPVSSLYHHVRSREDVLTQIANESAQDLSFAPADPKRWRKWLRDAASRFLSFARQHAPGLASGKGPVNVGAAVFEPFLETLEEAGFTTRQAVLIANAIAGWANLAALTEQKFEAAGGRKQHHRRVREAIAAAEPLLAPRTFRAMPVMAQFEVDELNEAHLEWLIGGIPDPR